MGDSLKTPPIIGQSPCFVAALELARKVAPSSASIFLTGESGTGKELFARFIHAHGMNKNGPFVAINCSAIPENLLESELFGHTKGAFTGAFERRIGLFEEAQNGTVFLDEIGDLDLSLQAKLLRVLQDKQIKRVGDNQVRSVNCRVISATHKNLAKDVKDGKFREDLFFRLNVIPIHLPSLRERKSDIPILAQNFIKKYSFDNASLEKKLTPAALQFIVENSWPGNVRELQNTIERAVILCKGNEIDLEDFLIESSAPPRIPETIEIGMGNSYFTININGHLPTLNEVTNRYIEFAVGRNGGARDRTAREIGIDRKTLYKRIKTEIQAV